MNQLLEAYSNLIKSNPVYAGFITLYVTTIGGWLLRNLPRRFFNFILGQYTTHLDILSTGAGPAELQYFSFLEWFAKNGFMKWSRRLAVESIGGMRNQHSSSHSRTIVTPGNGKHYFFWRGRLCWLHKSRVDQNGTTDQITHEITVGAFGRNKQFLFDMVEDFRWVPSPAKEYIYYSEYSRDYRWVLSHKVVARHLDTIVLNNGLKERIVKNIQWFLDNRSWFEDRGFPYRLIIVLEGPPGTGKTSLLRALAGYFKRNLCPLNLSTCTDSSLPELLRTVPRDSFVLMEDFDDCLAVVASDWVKSNNVNGFTAPESILRLSRSAFLQAIDGQIIFLTTNHIDKIDEAVKRDERVNHRFHIGLLQNEAIHRYIETVFPNFSEHNAFVYAPISGASLQKLYRKYHASYGDFIGAIPVANPDILLKSREEVT
jgi:mitochondrial chaperone BCS1